jgi:hypothetical protein
MEMSSVIVRGANKVIREVRSPADAAKFCWRMLFPVDPHLWQRHSWFWGNLPRLELKKVMPGIELTSIVIHEALGRTFVTALDLEELSCLLAIVKFIEAKRIFEIGTSDGSTTVNLAANSAPDARIVTLDLPPDWSGNLSMEVPADYRNVTNRGGIGKKFRNTSYENKIEQLFGDSAEMDWSQLGGPFDVIFIDGCHYYDYVAKDTENALKHLSPQGLVIWHDYGSIKGVSDLVDETSLKIRVCAIVGTRLAVGFPGTKP